MLWGVGITNFARVSYLKSKQIRAGGNPLYCFFIRPATSCGVVLFYSVFIVLFFRFLLYIMVNLGLSVKHYFVFVFSVVNYILQI